MLRKPTTGPFSCNMRMAGARGIHCMPRAASWQSTLQNTPGERALLIYLKNIYILGGKRWNRPKQGGEKHPCSVSWHLQVPCASLELRNLNSTGCAGFYVKKWDWKPMAPFTKTKRRRKAGLSPFWPTNLKAKERSKLHSQPHKHFLKMGKPWLPLLGSGFGELLTLRDFLFVLLGNFGYRQGNCTAEKAL